MKWLEGFKKNQNNLPLLFSLKKKKSYVLKFARSLDPFWNGVQEHGEENSEVGIYFLSEKISTMFSLADRYEMYNTAVLYSIVLYPVVWKHQRRLVLVQVTFTTAFSVWHFVDIMHSFLGSQSVCYRWKRGLFYFQASFGIFEWIGHNYIIKEFSTVYVQKNKFGLYSPAFKFLVS